MNSGNNKWGLVCPVRLRAQPPRFAFHVTHPTKEVRENDRRYAAEHGLLQTHWPSTNECGEIRRRKGRRGIKEFDPEKNAWIIRRYRTSTRCGAKQCLVCSGWKRPCDRCLNPNAPILTVTLRSSYAIRASEPTGSVSVTQLPKRKPHESDEDSYGKDSPRRRAADVRIGNAWQVEKIITDDLFKTETRKKTKGVCQHCGDRTINGKCQWVHTILTNGGRGVSVAARVAAGDRPRRRLSAAVRLAERERAEKRGVAWLFGQYRTKFKGKRPADKVENMIIVQRIVGLLLRARQKANIEKDDLLQEGYLEMIRATQFQPRSKVRSLPAAIARRVKTHLVRMIQKQHRGGLPKGFRPVSLESVLPGVFV